MFNIHIEIERWKYNKNYKLYVSNLGNFKDKSKEPITPKVEKGGYLILPVCNNKRGEVKYLYAHRIVMETWCPRADMWKEKLTVDHLNHNKRFNAVKNLEWVSQEENQKRAAADMLYDDKDTLIQSLRDRVKNLENRVEILECGEKDNVTIVANNIKIFHNWGEVKTHLVKLNPDIGHCAISYIKSKIEKAERTKKTYCGYNWKINK